MLNIWLGFVDEIFISSDRVLYLGLELEGNSLGIMAIEIYGLCLINWLSFAIKICFVSLLEMLKNI
jgi:hypothetical protein